MSIPRTAIFATIALVCSSVPARADTFVSRATGSDLNVCTAPNVPCQTINAGIALAQPGDTVFVTWDIYTGTGPGEIVRVNKSVTLSGGWNATFTTRVHFTALNGQNQRRGIVVTQGVDAIIRDFFVIFGWALHGGGIYVEGGLHAERLIVGQSFAWNGAGIFFNGNLGNNLVLVDSVLIGNNYAVAGGGLFVDGFRFDDPTNPNHVNSTVLFNVTVTSNLSVNSLDEEHGVPPTWGGGIYVAHGAYVEPVHTTFAENERFDGRIFTKTNAGVAVDNLSTVNFKNTLVADGCTATVPAFQFMSQGNNVERLNTCNFTLPFDRNSVNPLIYPLSLNPGPITTITHALKGNSPATDWASPAFCTQHDQRGVARPQGVVCDVGAYERSASDPAMGFITHPGRGFADSERCPTLAWDPRGRERHNPCRVSTDDLMRALLSPSSIPGVPPISHPGR